MNYENKQLEQIQTDLHSTHQYIETIQTVILKLQDDLAEAYRRIQTQQENYDGLNADYDHLQTELTATIRYIEDLEQWVNRNTPRP